jgi:glycyl-tRNA synthetase (class II)
MKPGTKIGLTKQERRAIRIFDTNKPVGTPGITVDFESDAVTLRDSLEQIRVPIEGLGEELVSRLEAPWQNPKLA